MLAYLLPILLVFTTVGLNTLAQTLLKIGSGQGLLNIHLLGGIVVYGISTIFYIMVLSKFNLSVIYPIVIGLTIFSATVSGAVLLGEKVIAIQWIGIGLMLAGISAIACAKYN